MEEEDFGKIGMKWFGLSVTAFLSILLAWILPGTISNSLGVDKFLVSLIFYVISFVTFAFLIYHVNLFTSKNRKQNGSMDLKIFEPPAILAMLIWGFTLMCLFLAQYQFFARLR